MTVFRAQPFAADPGAAAEQERQLTGVVLGVTEIVQQELADVQLVPPEAAPFEGALIGQLLEGLVAFAEAVVGVVQQLVLGESYLRSGDDPAVFLIVPGKDVCLILVAVDRLEDLFIL